MNEIERAELARTTVQCFTGLKGSLDNFPALLKKVIEERAWERRLHNGRLIELASLRELVTLKPLEGWGQNPSKIEAVIKDNAEVLAMWEREMQVGQGHRSDLVDNVNDVGASKGNSKAYTVSRLKRESPELFEKVVAGELSANAAAIKAGWRKVKSPLEHLNQWWSKASEEERAAFMAEVKGGAA
jgi:hypothetical protein